MYRTNSIQLASVLCTMPKVNLIDVDRTIPEKIFFIFDNEDCEDYAKQYFARSLENIPQPLEVFEKYRTLKELIFETKAKR